MERLRPTREALLEGGQRVKDESGGGTTRASWMLNHGRIGPLLSNRSNVPTSDTHKLSFDRADLRKIRDGEPMLPCVPQVAREAVSVGTRSQL